MSGISALMKQARAEAGLTLRELAELAGTSSATLSTYETGAKDPRASTLLRVLAATGTELSAVPARTVGQRFVDLLCERIAEQVATDPSLVEAARAKLPRLRGRSGSVDAWERLLDAGPAAVIGVLTSASPEVSALKADSPFALLGLVSDEQRSELLAVADAA